MCPVVYSRYVYVACEVVCQHCCHLIHAHGDRSCRVFAVANVLQSLHSAPAFVVELVGNLVAYAPKNYARMVAEHPYHLRNVVLRPLVEVRMIAAVALRDVPFIERFHQEHEAEAVALACQLGRRNVV